jgi:hypothetical protein
MTFAPLRRSFSFIAAALAFAPVAGAHPGHIPLDVIHASTQSGHAGQYGSAVVTLAIVTLVWAACRLASRKS